VYEFGIVTVLMGGLCSILARFFFTFGLYYFRLFSLYKVDGYGLQEEWRGIGRY
jgi:hypothetical protein